MRRLMLALLLSACSTAAPPPPEAPGARHNPMAPVTLKLDVVGGQPVAGERMAFRARLERNGVWDAPIAVEFQVPVGAVVVGGTERGVVTGAAAPELELQLDRVPDGDLIVVASSQTDSSGFHAEARYRFGRPDPLPTGPPKDGPAMTGPNGVDLGTPVDMN